jgi:formate hydrogenlyase subunit 3/multisubunit Na+/H+ antiporter MnhD subunit
MSVLLLAAAVVPMLVALGVALPTRWRGWALALAPWAAAPALALSLQPEAVPPVTLPWLLLETRIGLDGVGQVFLFFTALLWTVAGIYARTYLAEDPGARRFVVFYLLTMSGNLGLVVAHDLVTFYAAFALMTFGAYPLVVHRGDAVALRAGRVYVVMAVIGETMLLLAFILAALEAESLALRAVAAGVAASPARDLIVGLLLAGFGVKAGAVPLHLWLPLAHPVAPTPASAVLSGSMIKAGLLGWLRFLPLGLAALPEWGAVVIGLGLAAAFFGVLIGVTQDDPKTALAYSSISQMGIINIGVGLGLANPEGAAAALAACLAYAVHHGLAKGALFLGVGVALAAGASPLPRRLVLAGLAFAALAVAGAPLTSGMVGKSSLKGVAAWSPGPWPEALDWLLPVTAVGTTLLMGRFLLRVLAHAGAEAHPALPPGLWVPWTALLIAVGGVVWVLPRYHALDLEPSGLPGLGTLWESVWPLALGALLLWTALRASRRLGVEASRCSVAPGDLLIPVERALDRLRRAAGPPEVAVTPVVSLASEWYGVYARGERTAAAGRMEGALTRWITAGVLAALLAAVLYGLLALR